MVRQVAGRLATRREQQLNEEFLGQAALPQALLDNTGSAIFSTTVKDVITSCNRSAGQLTRELGRNIDPGFEVLVAKTQGPGGWLLPAAIGGKTTRGSQ